MTQKQYPVIGSKYTGKHELQIDTRAGTFSECHPMFTKHESHLQTVLLEHAEREARRRPRTVRQVFVPDESVCLASDRARNVLKQTAAYFAATDHLALEDQNKADSHAA
jgi:hypothetical protein